MGASPEVVVDLFDGHINVVQSTDGRVTAVIKRFSVAQNSQSAADAALSAIQVSSFLEGDSIRVIIRSAPEVGVFQLKADVELRVPEDARLDLLAGEGDIYIGHGWGGPYGAYLTSAPVRLKSVKARTLGRIFKEIDAVFLKGASEPENPPLEIPLDLESLHGTVNIQYQ